VFEHSGVRDLVQASIRGYNATLFAYGPTGCGKTYTTLGEVSPAGFALEGLVPRCVRDLHGAADALLGRDVKLRVSCLEIYRDVIHDLLVSGPPPREGAASLLCREHPKYGFFVDGLVLKPCPTVAATLAAVAAAFRVRHTGTHRLNERSSRSHVLLTLHVDSLPCKAPGDGPPAGEPPTYGSLSVVDLAGSERPKETGSSGGTLREAGHINKSLYTLGKVIAGMAKPLRPGQKRRNVPFRDSALTKLLIGSLGGASKTLMIGCVSPASAALPEALRTLAFASQVSVIENRPAVRLDPREKLIADLRLEIDRLRDENDRLYEALKETARSAGTLPALAPSLLAPPGAYVALAAAAPPAALPSLPAPRPASYNDAPSLLRRAGRAPLLLSEEEEEEAEDDRRERALAQLLDAQGFGPKSAPAHRRQAAPAAALPVSPLPARAAWPGPWPVEGAATPLAPALPPSQWQQPAGFVAATPTMTLMPTAGKSNPSRSSKRHLGLYGGPRAYDLADSRAAKKEEMEALVRDIQMRTTRGNSFMF
jgi:hypothetical protein